jgi:hypothetical protein
VVTQIICVEGLDSRQRIYLADYARLITALRPHKTDLIGMHPAASIGLWPYIQ